MRSRLEQFICCLLALALCLLHGSRCCAQGVMVTDDTGQTRLAHIYNAAGTLLHFAMDEVNGRYLADEDQIALGDYDGDGDSDGAGLTTGTFAWVVNGHATSIATTEYPRWSGIIEMKDGEELDLAAIDAATPDPIAPIKVHELRTWYPSATNGSRSDNIRTIKAFAGTTTFAVEPLLNTDADIQSITSVVVTGPASEAATNHLVRADGRAAHFDLTSVTTTGTYTIVCTVLTKDGQTLSLECTLKVR
jgi:hypothetical protein